MKNTDIEKLLDFSIKAHAAILTEKNLKFDIQENIETDYYKVKESILNEIKQAFDEFIIKLKIAIDELESEKIECTELGDTNSVNLLIENLNMVNKALIEAENQKREAISDVSNRFNPIIKIEHETTAFYSEPNYNGNIYVVTKNEKSAIMRFEPLSIRVAKGCTIQVFPYENFRAHSSYKAPIFKKSTSKSLMHNTWSESMINGGFQLRATSWKLNCS